MKVCLTYIFLFLYCTSISFAQSPDQEIDVTPSSFDFEEVVVGQSKDHSFVITNQGSIDELVVFSTELMGDDAEEFRLVGGSGGVIINPGSTRLITVRLTPTSLGQKDAFLRIESDDPDENFLDIPLTGIGKGLPNIALNRNSLQYGSVLVNGTRILEVVVTNNGLADLELTGIDITGPGASMFEIVEGGGPDTLIIQEQKIILVGFTPASDGDKNATLVFSSNDPEDGSLELGMFGRGISPEVAIDRTSHDYGDVALSTNAVTGFFVSNAGPGNLIVDYLTIEGQGADQFTITRGAPPFTVLPEDVHEITVQFRPAAAGVQEAVLTLPTNDLDEPVIEISLTGTTIIPNIAVNDTMFLMEAPLGAVSDTSFIISNTGMADLVVDSLIVTESDPEFDQFILIGPTPPFSVTPGDSAEFDIRFRPALPGTQEATLTLYTNDLEAGTLGITLVGVTLIPNIVSSAPEIVFNDLLIGLGATEVVFLGNEGSASLTLLESQITGGDSTQFVLETGNFPIAVFPGESVALSVRFIPDSEGEKQSTLRILSNDLDQPGLEIALLGRGNTIAPEIEEFVAMGADVEIAFTLPQGIQPDTRELFYRSVGDSVFQTLDIEGSGPDYLVTIPGSAVQPTGIEYYIRVVEGGNQATIPVIDPVLHPLFIPVRFSAFEAPLASSRWSYQMISVPVLLDDKAPASVLEDDLGPWNPRHWRLFHWDDDAYTEYPAIEGGFDSGRGFWLITNNGSTFDVEEGLSSDPSRPFNLTLQPGWNQIGNPFASSVRWPADVIDPSIEPPVSFDGIEFQYNTAVLQPWAGYFVRNLSANPITISLSPRPSNAGKRQENSSGASHRIQIIAEVEGEPYRDSQTFVGFSEDAEDGLDRYDFTEAPPIGSYVRVSVVEAGERFAGNFKPLEGDGQFWDLEIDGTFSQKSVSVRFRGLEDLPEGYKLFVVDTDARQPLAVVDSSFIIDYREAHSIRKIRVVLGKAEYASEHVDDIPLVPVAFGLEQNYPNPFNQETTIRYGIEKSTPVRLEIYNLTGKRVRTLINRSHEAGVHTAHWDGKNESGLDVASGVYIYQLRAGEFITTRKMLYVR